MHEDGRTVFFHEKQGVRQNPHGHPVAASREVLVNFASLVGSPWRTARQPMLWLHVS